MTTSVDVQTCQLIMLDSNIQSMTEFKQIIGRGTRINEEFGRKYFTILDFRDVTNLLLILMATKSELKRCVLI
jgi:type I restriction enzyme R subunit